MPDKSKMREHTSINKYAYLFVKNANMSIRLGISSEGKEGTTFSSSTTLTLDEVDRLIQTLEEYKQYLAAYTLKKIHDPKNYRPATS